MAAYDFSRAPAASNGTIARLGTHLASLLGVFATWRDAYQTRRALNELSDRELDDIGLVRGDIDAIADDGTLRF